MTPLISAAELAQQLAGPRPPVVLDVRWRLTGPPGRADYLGGHVPGAVFVDLDVELADPPGPRGRHPLPDPARLQEALRRHGVRAGRATVAYDDGDGGGAARAWWVLRWAGLHEVAVLDGGWRAWVAAGLPVQTGESRPAEGDVVVTAGQLPVLTADEAAALARDGVLLDARSAERYRGEVEPVDPVAGHIPGATSAPVAGNVDQHGLMLAPGALRRRYAALGVAGQRPVGSYCGSGVNAAHHILALELIGVRAALYAGSWSEWVADPGRPVATGPDSTGPDSTGPDVIRNGTGDGNQGGAGQ